MRAVLNRFGLLAAVAMVLAIPSRAFAASAQHNPFQGIAVGGRSADGNVFKGTMDVLGFVNDGGVLKALGSLNGTLTSAAGAATQIAGAMVAVPVNLPAAAAAPTGFGGMAPAQQAVAVGCNILHLDLGPLDLNLLGLAVHLDEVVLDITAVPGAGNLVGNLLCAVANLLNGVTIGGGLVGGLVTSLTTLLNNLLAAL